MAATSFVGENEEVDDDAPLLLGILCVGEERQGARHERYQQESSSFYVARRTKETGSDDVYADTNCSNQWARCRASSMEVGYLF